METTNTINFNDLKRELPYKWRVQSFSKFKPEATCVAYIDSRDVQKLLDEIVGPENWQDKYYAVKDNLFCQIGIRVDGEWTWKGDCGVESNVDKEKGEASDAFKRAAVKWGIGRFLYDLGMHKLKTDKKLGESPGNPTLIDANGQKIWNVTEHINSLKAHPVKPEPKRDPHQEKAEAPEPTLAEKIMPENQAPASIKYATPNQKEVIQRLLNNPIITRQEKTKMLLNINKLDEVRASQVIDKLHKVIEDRTQEDLDRKAA